jgi:hypothetical protein
MKKNGNKAGPPKAQSPVVQTRKVKPMVQLRLFVDAGGRCEYDGCNKYLLEHSLTLDPGNFAEMAHVVAFREDGPRGHEPRPADINQLSNLMLLCAECHKLIDDRPDEHTRKQLESYKEAHETRIKLVTSLGPNRRTAVLEFKALIRGDAVAIPRDQIAEATAPRYPSTIKPYPLDLTGMSGPQNEPFYAAACQAIAHGLERFLGPGGEAASTGHVSAFALGPIPLLVCLGRQLSNKVPTDLFQRHRDTERWTWKDGGDPVEYAFRTLRRGDGDRVALVLSLSGTIALADLPADLPESATVYELTLADGRPRPTFLNQRRDLEAFRVAYQEAIASMQAAHGAIPAIDLFPAVPAPVAVLCGRELLPRVHPKLRLWDNDRQAGGFTFKLEI